MSPRLSDWKSHGETRTMSLSALSKPFFLTCRTRVTLLTVHKIRSKRSIVTAMPRTSLATGNTIFSISSSLMIFFLPKVLFPLEEEPYFKTLVLLTQKTRRFDSTDYFYQTSQRLARHTLSETSPNEAVLSMQRHDFSSSLMFSDRPPDLSTQESRRLAN